MGLPCNSVQGVDVKTWWASCGGMLDSDGKGEFAAALWGIWYARNELVWSNVQLTPAKAAGIALAVLNDWRLAQVENGSIDSNNSGSLRW